MLNILCEGPCVISSNKESTLLVRPTSEVLVVTDWGRRVGFYDLDGNSIKRDDMVLNYDPTCVEFIPSGQFLLIGGSGRQVTLHTRLGTEIGTVAQMDTWVWCVRVRPVSNPSTVVVGCVDGTIACYNLMFSTIHGLHKERYAFRDNMTDVVVQHLIHHTMTRIRCHDLVKKVAIYGHKLAVQLSDRLHIYRQIKGDGENEQLEYTLSERINKAFDCSLLVIGGPPGRETILIGLREGQVCKLFVDNPFPVQVLKLNGPIKCIDISATRRHIAVVDDSGLCVVFDAKTKEVLFEEPNCNSVAFNSDNEEIICYSGSSKLTVRARGYPGHQQRMFGFVVGFSGNKVYCLHIYAMQALEVPFSNQLYQYIENKEYQKAYDLACLGVTREDWQILAMDAISNLNCEIALKAFARYKDHRSIQLVHEIKAMLAANEPDYILRAHVLCYEGKFREAAALYRSNGDENRAMQLFTDLRMFDDAQEVMASASGETQRMLMRKRADWARDSNQPKIAAEMLISSGDLDKAVILITDNDWMDLAINVMRKLERSDVDSLRRLAAYFIRKSEFNLAARIYGNINDIKAVAQMHVAAGHWTDNQPFTRHSPETLLNMARYLAAQPPVPNISQVLICYTIARIGRELGAYKLARDTLDRLGNLRVPPRLQRDVELMTVNIRAKPFSDVDDLLPVFHSDDFEMAVLQEGHCPFCRSVQERSDNAYLIDEA
ncbi:WD domain, G-beta repeat protein [Cooperia oncophora]